jgi:hypothetical protein
VCTAYCFCYFLGAMSFQTWMWRFNLVLLITLCYQVLSWMNALPFLQCASHYYISIRHITSEVSVITAIEDRWMKDEFGALVEYWQGKTKVLRVQPLQCKSKQDWLGIELGLRSDMLLPNHHNCRTADYSYQIVPIWLLGSRVIFIYSQHLIIL